MPPKRKKRKGAGPPPVGTPKRPSVQAAAAASADKPTAKGPKRAPGEPVPSTFKGVLIRALMVTALFYPYLVYIAGESPATSLLICALALALMLPLGLLIDRLRYQRQLKRYQARKAQRSPGR